MTNAVAYWIAGLVLAILVANFALDWQLHVFLGRRFLDLVQWIAFWR